MTSLRKSAFEPSQDESKEQLKKYVLSGVTLWLEHKPFLLMDENKKFNMDKEDPLVFEEIYYIAMTLYMREPYNYMSEISLIEPEEKIRPAELELRYLQSAYTLFKWLVKNQALTNNAFNVFVKLSNQEASFFRQNKELVSDRCKPFDFPDFMKEKVLKHARLCIVHNMSKKKKETAEFNKLDTEEISSIHRDIKDLIDAENEDINTMIINYKNAKSSM